jgi:uncharacterized protein (TIGR02118 family)
MRLFILIRRDPAETHEQFMAWWSERHAELARRMPGLRRYVLHEVLGGFERDVDWDGIAELEFDSEDAARAAFSSPEGRETLQDTKGRGGARLILSTDMLRLVKEG